MKPKLTWMLAPISVGAFLATWGGWAKLASMTGYRDVEMIPGVGWTFNIGIVLPITVEPFGAFAMMVAFNPAVKRWARVLAGTMALSALVAAGICQAVVHHLTVEGKDSAPPVIVTISAILPVIVIGLSAALGVLHNVRVDDDGTTHGTTRVGFLGRIGTALGDAAATRAEQFAESTRVTQQVTQADPGTMAGTTQLPVPAAPAMATQPAPEPSQPRVPAAQGPKPGRDELMVKVSQLRLATDPGTGRPTSYAKIGDELGISKSEAQRLGTLAEAKLPGTTDPTQVISGTTPGTTLNGHKPELETISTT